MPADKLALARTALMMIETQRQRLVVATLFCLTVAMMYGCALSRRALACLLPASYAA